MEMKHNTHTSPGKWQEVPLPGHYPCLTWQLNLTLHPQSELVKFVSVIREPIGQFEVARGFMDPTQFRPGFAATIEQCQEALRTLGYLSGLTKGV